MHGKNKCNKLSFMEHDKLSEFITSDLSKNYQQYFFLLLSCFYTIISGTGFLQAIWMKIDYQHDVIKWLGIIIDIENLQDWTNFFEIQDIGLSHKIQHIWTNTMNRIIKTHILLMIISYAMMYEVFFPKEIV